LIVCLRHWRSLRQDRSLALVGANNEPLVESVIANKLIKD
jgi:hypothetical protein